MYIPLCLKPPKFYAGMRKECTQGTSVISLRVTSALTDSTIHHAGCVRASLRNRFNMAGLSRVMGGRLGSLGRSLRNTQLLLQSRILIYITA